MTMILYLGLSSPSFAIIFRTNPAVPLAEQAKTWWAACAIAFPAHEGTAQSAGASGDPGDPLVKCCGVKKTKKIIPNLYPILAFWDILGYYSYYICNITIITIIVIIIVYGKPQQRKSMATEPSSSHWG